MEETLTEPETTQQPMEAQKSKKKGKKKTKKKKIKYSSEKQVEDSNKKHSPPLKSEDYDGWKSWYKEKILI